MIARVCSLCCLIVLNVLALHCYPIGRTVATAEALFQNNSLDLHARDSLSFTLLYHLATFKPGDCDLSVWRVASEPLPRLAER